MKRQLAFTLPAAVLLGIGFAISGYLLTHDPEPAAFFGAVLLYIYIVNPLLAAVCGIVVGVLRGPAWTIVPLALFAWVPTGAAVDPRQGWDLVTTFGVAYTVCAALGLLLGCGLRYLWCGVTSRSPRGRSSDAVGRSC